MQRAPLLHTIKSPTLRHTLSCVSQLSSGGKASSPFGSLPSPGSYSSELKSINSVLNIVKAISAIVVLVCLGTFFLFADALTQGSSDDVLHKLQTAPGSWGPEAPRFQSCRLPPPHPSLPKLVPIQRWKSLKHGQEESISIITHVSFERLSLLKLQCRSWNDRIFAAVYVPHIDGFGGFSARVAAANGTSLTSIAHVLNKFHKETDNDPQGCALEIELVAEEFKDFSDPALPRYPANSLRNRALLLAEKTDLVMLLDANYLPNALLPHHYHSRPRTFTKMVESLVEHRTAIVLPILRPTGSAAASETREMVNRVILGGKAHVIDAVEKNALAALTPARDLGVWMRAEKTYPIEYESGSYEPAMIVPRQYVPFYDEKFRGNVGGKDAALHASHMMKGLQVALQMHPSVFVIQSSGGYAPGVEDHDDLVEGMYAAGIEEIKEHAYAPVTSFAASCPKTFPKSPAADGGSSSGGSSSIIKVMGGEQLPVLGTNAEWKGVGASMARHPGGDALVMKAKYSDDEDDDDDDDNLTVKPKNMNKKKAVLSRKFGQ